MTITMARVRSTFRLPLLLLACCAPAAVAAAPDAGPATRGAESRPAPAAAGGVTVAVLDFESSTPGSPDLGRQIAEVLVASLSGEPGFQLVDRAAMANVLRENELGLTGLVGPADATKVGKVVGARILVTGKAFAVDKQVFITAKLIGTETTLVDGIVVKGPREGDTGDLVMQLAQKVGDRLRTAGPKLVAADESLTDPLPGLKAALAGRALPRVGVTIAERHVARAAAAGIDPAVETEVRNVLVAAGFTVVDGGEREWDRAGVEVAVTGEAFSEFNARIGNLVSCSGRAEVKAVDRRGNRLLFADRATTRGVDLAENVAGKTALQKGGRELGIRLLRHFADTLPASPAGGGAATRPTG
jgi:TolB-like protein